MTTTRYGILAGHGGLLTDVIEGCVHHNLSYFVVAFHGQTQVETIQHHPHAWVDLGKINQTLSLLKNEKITHLIMAGRFKRPSFSDLKLDTMGALWMAELGLKALGDDGLLKGLMGKLEAQGFMIVSPETIIGLDACVPKGNSGLIMPTSYHNDGQLGFAVLRALSPFDCGQGVVIQEGRVLGIEGPENTNHLLKRCAGLAIPDKTLRRPILVKACKTNQETRADRPAVGPTTLLHLAELHYGGLYVQANEVIIAQKTLFYDTLHKTHLFCYGHHTT